MRSFFYARVSSKDQSLERQLASAKELGIDDEYVFIEKASGKDFKRPEYQLMKRMLRSGDVLYITSLDRLGRNKQMILDEWQELTKKKCVDIAVMDMPLLNTAKYREMQGLETLISDLVLQLLSYMAEDERKRIKERQKEGIQVALKKGIRFGRKKQEIDERFHAIYTDWKSGKITAVAAMDMLGMKRNTFYRRVAEWEQKTP
jgi:DNA invertase Pin-like site-specific DNA recombinase